MRGEQSTPEQSIRLREKVQEKQGYGPAKSSVCLSDMRSAKTQIIKDDETP